MLAMKLASTRCRSPSMATLKLLPHSGGEETGGD
jgi:hypothetical protein